MPSYETLALIAPLRRGRVGKAVGWELAALLKRVSPVDKLQGFLSVFRVESSSMK
jgi:hypothetical protein